MNNNLKIGDTIKYKNQLWTIEKFSATNNYAKIVNHDNEYLGVHVEILKNCKVKCIRCADTGMIMIPPSNAAATEMEFIKCDCQNK